MHTPWGSITYTTIGVLGSRIGSFFLWILAGLWVDVSRSFSGAYHFFLDPGSKSSDACRLDSGTCQFKADILGVRV